MLTDPVLRQTKTQKTDRQAANKISNIWQMWTKEQAYEKIKSLVQWFDEQKEFYKRQGYNETQTRRDFIDPFWKVLGIARIKINGR